MDKQQTEKTYLKRNQKNKTQNNNSRLRKKQQRPKTQMQDSKK
jgi:hypothetical protein